jgi:hypothetical protein
LIWGSYLLTTQKVIAMRTTLIAALAASVMALVVLSPKPALSLPAAAALKHAQPDAGIAHEVKKYRYRYWGGRPYYRGYYGYRPYYRPYYYRPYYYGHGYPYWRRPGFSIWFGF